MIFIVLFNLFKFFMTRMFSCSKHRIISGMVIAPLSWCREEWVDYTFAANLAPCLLNILQQKDPRCPAIISHQEHGSLILLFSIIFNCYSSIHPRVMKSLSFCYIYRSVR